MLIDRPQIVEGSVIINATVPSGPTNPLNPSIGELFFNTSSGELLTYTGVWNAAITSDVLTPMLELLAPLSSPAFIGVPTAPTAVPATASNQIATTAYVTSAVGLKANTSHTHVIADVAGLQSALDLKAVLSSPAFTGVPTAPTAPPNTNTTQLASTAFVIAQIGSTGASGSATISGGSIDGAAIGGTTPAAGSFTTLVSNTLTSNTMNLGGGTPIAGSPSSLNIDYVGGSTQYGITLQATTAGNTTALNFFNSAGVSIGSITQTDSGITFNGTATAAPWSGITGKPTTLTGYGITDAQPLDSDLTAIAALVSNGIIARTGAGAAAVRSIAVSGTGLSISNADGVSGNPTVSSNGTALNTASTLVARDGSGNFAAGTITATLSGNATSASTAAQLTTARTLSVFGDAAGSASFDGSANAAISLTLANSGATAGTFKSVTVDAKGRVTAGTNPTTLAGYGITDAVPLSQRGVANGVATLDSSGLIPSSQLPSYVDDVLEYANFAALPGTGEVAKIYITLSDGKIFRWSGSAYIEISPTVGNTDTATRLATARTISATGDGAWSVSFDGSASVTSALTLANSGVTAGTFKSVTVDAKGRVTAGTNPTTLAGYGITDAVPLSHVGSTGVAHGVATTVVNGFMSSTDKTKLDGIATGAQVNTVTSVAGKTGAVTLVKADVGLTNVDDTADAAKIVAQAAKLSTARTISSTGDGTWSVSFDGSANATAAFTLANSGVTAGTYNSSGTAITPLVIDAKGRITGSGAAITITPAWTSITSKPTTLAGYGITDALAIVGGVASNGSINATSYLRVGGTGVVANSTLYVQGTVAQNITAITTNIDWSAGNYVTKTISGATTFTFSNFPASAFVMITMKLTNGGSAAITWPASVKWSAGAAPTFTTSGVDIVNLFSDDGGVTVYAILAGKGMA